MGVAKLARDHKVTPQWAKLAVEYVTNGHNLQPAAQAAGMSMEATYKAHSDERFSALVDHLEGEVDLGQKSTEQRISDYETANKAITDLLTRIGSLSALAAAGKLDAPGQRELQRLSTAYKTLESRKPAEPTRPANIGKAFK